MWNICCNSAGPGGLGCKSKLFTISRFAPKVFFVDGLMCSPSAATRDFNFANSGGLSEMSSS
ncbi:hypothetical protein ANAPH2_01094 [Anaplasma phagocytophilum]|nr:hypothetical protein ANAPH2_01094 [Anaplasma phagocytophilum]